MAPDIQSLYNLQTDTGSPCNDGVIDPIDWLIIAHNVVHEETLHRPRGVGLNMKASLTRLVVAEEL